MKRTLAVLLALVLLCAFFCIAAEAEHDCAGENCVICALLHACLRTLSLSLLCAAVLFTAGLSLLLHGVCRPVTQSVCRFSPVLQKVKLSN